MLRRFSIVTAICSTGLSISLAWTITGATPAKQSTADCVEAWQQPPSSEQLPPAGNAVPYATLRVTTRLVQVNVIVNDKHGNPITGLSKGDFLLLDDKHPQEIRLFSAETNSVSNQHPSPLPHDTFTNLLSEHATVPSSVTVILLDALNTEFADQALSRKQVLRFLQQLRPQDRVALYWLGNNLYTLQDFTTDAANLREALAHSAPKSSRDLSESNVDYLNPNNPNSSIPSGVPAGQASNREAFRSAFDQRVANESAKNRVRLTVAA